MNNGSLHPPDWLRRSLPALLALLLLFNLVWTAWLCDDAFISFRSVRNFVEGHGLAFNPAERVQSFTHPLWVLLLIPLYALTGEIVFTAMVTGLLVTGIAIFRLLRSTTELRWDAAGLLLLLLGSHAFIDYSTSGLENPLSHLLIALFLTEWLREKRPSYLALWAGLTMLNRLDLALLFVVPLALTLWQRRSWTTVRQLAIGFLPLLLWEAFSLLYYGFLFPNTAYAKLSTGIDSGELWSQGWAYWMFTLENDPVTALVIVLGAAAGIWWPQTRWLAVGIVFRWIYVLEVGGDFMGGRFYTTEFFLGLGLLAVVLRERFADRRWALPGLAAGLFLLGMAVRPPAFLKPLPSPLEAPEIINDNGIADERAFYAPQTALLNRILREDSLIFRWEKAGLDLRQQGTPVSLQYNMGFIGWGAGPENHLVDHFGLTDPLLARLPMLYDPAWRIGHYVRVVPDGYLESVQQNKPVIKDEGLNEYYQRLRTVTRDPVFSWTRLKEVARFNLGWNAHLVDARAYRFPVRHRLGYQQINEPGEANLSLNHFYGAEIALPGGPVQRFYLSGKCCGEYQTVLFDEGEIVFAKAFRVTEENCPDATCTIEVGVENADKFVVYPLSETGDFPLTQFRVE